MKITRSMLTVVFGMVTLLVGGIAPVFADVVNIDENGDGDFNFGTPGTTGQWQECGGAITRGCWTMTGSSALFNGYLTYIFPTGVTVRSGDVVFNEPVTGDRSDGLRFTNNTFNRVVTSADRVVFFSDQSDANDTRLADSGFPTNLGAARNFNPVVTLSETGLPPGCLAGAYTEQRNGFCYTPTATQPGFRTGHTVTYNGISDTAVPEASALMELSFVPGGLLLLTALRRRRIA